MYIDDEQEDIDLMARFFSDYITPKERPLVVEAARKKKEILDELIDVCIKICEDKNNLVDKFANEITEQCYILWREYYYCNDKSGWLDLYKNNRMAMISLANGEGKRRHLVPFKTENGPLSPSYRYTIIDKRFNEVITNLLKELDNAVD